MAQTPSAEVADPSAAASPSTESSMSTVSSVSTVSSMSYEQARDELVTVVTELEQGSSTLERSLALWERGEALAARCEEWLLGAKERLERARRVEGAE